MPALEKTVEKKKTTRHRMRKSICKMLIRDLNLEYVKKSQ
jgi:hypothetical protein